MNVENMRASISKVYPGKEWHRRCLKMAPNQVIAIYRKFEKEGRFSPAGIVIKPAVKE